MNFAYIVCSPGYLDDMLLMIKSLNNHCDCNIIILSHNIPEIKDIIKVKNNVYVYDVSDNEWINKRMICKVERLLTMPFKENDRVFVLDTDIIIQDDIFKVFESKDDILYTSRHYDYFYPINAGVWGFVYNPRSVSFLRYHVEQAYNPTWKPYIDLINKRNHQNESLDWWCNQDFLCSIYENKEQFPIKCSIRDIGPMYNYCPSSDIVDPAVVINDIKDKKGKKDYKILHFKGPDIKPAMKDF